MAIELRDLHKSFLVSGRTRPVLRGLNLTLREGEITAVVGRSGCGKTTLLRILAGLEPWDAGEIAAPAGVRMGMVFQEARLMPWLNVRANIAFSGRNGRMAPERVQELIARVGLSGYGGAYPAQLSGGMRQRVSLARALAYEPDWLLMDEPFSALDYFTRADMQKELLEIQRAERRGILLVTHNLDEALFLADQVVLLQDGRVAQACDLRMWQKPRDPVSREAAAWKRKLLDCMEETR